MHPLSYFEKLQEAILVDTFNFIEKSLVNPYIERLDKLDEFFTMPFAKNE